MPLSLVFADQNCAGLEATVQFRASFVTSRQAIKQLARLTIEPAKRLFLDTVGDHAGDEVLGGPPPPPFLTMDHLAIPLRLLRKVWLTAAFSLIRQQAGANYPGDDQPSDVHGEFIPCTDFFADGSVWPDRLKEALINHWSHAGQTADGNLATFLAEVGLMPMYGMPTR